MNDNSLALLRFDFVIGDDVDGLETELRDRFGAPIDTDTRSGIGDGGREELTFEADGPGQLGLPPEFSSLTIRAIRSTDAVTELITLATIDENELSVDGSEASGDIGSAQIRAWENRLGNVRTFVPGTEGGPETTVFWIETDVLAGELRARPVDLEDAHRSLSNEETEEYSDLFGAGSGGGLPLPEHETLVLPRVPGQLWGTLVAIDFGENLSSTISSEGRRLCGPWRDLSGLYAIHFWCRVRGRELDAFEDELDAADAELPTTGENVDPDHYLGVEATIYELQGNWTSRYAQIRSEIGQLRRLHDDYSDRFDELSRRKSRTDPADADRDLLDSYIQRLADELERVEFDSGRLADRLDSLATAFHRRVSIAATREQIELRARLLWFTAAVVALTAILVTDMAMTGGLEAFVDRLFDQGLDAITLQVVTGVVTVCIAVASFALWRRS